ncbi:hypothetical protein [Parafrankia sp. EUN1f]|uniref:hypothetical protein n=1 Tax=Parafrankia sp. EUN1f TaxID=102897 RepID=UPI0001C46D1F|nr:hypothetical protein [Parafrankia sp. EUN1f]EFC80077.1 hypothetical protein FrEUN1fDRAFT_6804 [Parafrankia sp. EUN1f]
MTGGPYIHTIAYAPHHPEWAEVWGQIRASAITITVGAARNGVDLTTQAGTSGVTFNVPHLRVPILTLYAPESPAVPVDGEDIESVPSGRDLPWDRYLCAFLLRVRLLAKQASAITSDGAWTGEWLSARRIAAEAWHIPKDTEDPFDSPGVVWGGYPYRSHLRAVG